MKRKGSMGGDAPSPLYGEKSFSLRKAVDSQHTCSPSPALRPASPGYVEKLSQLDIVHLSQASWLQNIERPPSLDLFTEEWTNALFSATAPPLFEPLTFAIGEQRETTSPKPALKVSSQLLNPTFQNSDCSEDGDCRPSQRERRKGEASTKSSQLLRARNNSVRSRTNNYPVLPLSKQSSQMNLPKLAPSPAPHPADSNHFLQQEAASSVEEESCVCSPSEGSRAVCKSPPIAPLRFPDQSVDELFDPQALVTPTFKNRAPVNASPVRYFDFDARKKVAQKLLPQSTLREHTDNHRVQTALRHKRSKTETALNLPRIVLPETMPVFASDDVSLHHSLRLLRFERDYRVIAVIGHGRYGRVYHVEGRFDKLHYAIKEINLNEAAASNAQNEAQALAGISTRYESRYFVKYYSSWVEEDSVFICMELCAESLLSLKRKRPPGYFTEEFLRRVIRHICKALKKIHKDSIVHFDVKPENILLSHNNKFKLADLGLARNLRMREDVLSIQEGDCRYMARELLESGKDSPAARDFTKCDIFSLGISVFEMMVGERLSLPSNGPLWQDLRSGQAPLLATLPGFSVAFKRLVAAMMAPNPADRPSAQAILSKHLFKFERNYEKFLKLRIEYLEKKEQEHYVSRSVSFKEV